jgi:hypothetical protein
LKTFDLQGTKEIFSMRIVGWKALEGRCAGRAQYFVKGRKSCGGTFPSPKDCAAFRQIRAKRERSAALRGEKALRNALFEKH